MGHVIKKQVLDVGIQQSLDAFQVQHALSEWYWKQLVPLLERAFDEIAPPGEIIRIDQLQIDLGQLHPDHLQNQQWTAALQQTLVEELKKAIRDQASNDNPVSKQSPVIQAGRQWLYYMEHGSLPWNIDTIPDSWLNLVLQALATDSRSIDALRKLIIHNRVALLRIIRQHNNEFLTVLIKVLTAKQQSDLTPMMNELELIRSALQRNNGSLPTSSVFREQCLVLLLTDATDERHRFDQDNTAYKILQRIIPQQEIQAETNAQLSGRISTLEPVWKKYTTAIASGQHKREPITENELQLDLPGDPALEPPLQNNEKSDSSNDGLYTNMAGLVLLHPFLSMLFSQLNWVEKGAFRNKECQQRAIGLLHFLATGETIAPEYELGMAKLLCGYPLKEPVQAQFDFSGEELEEADHLLTVVISRWEVLKRTSVDGLREAFLQRKGKLSATETGMLLQVEQSSIDMLLDQLPWGISMIKLPWMHTLLRVEWR